jgi:hypothetical protein
VSLPSATFNPLSHERNAEHSSERTKREMQSNIARGGTPRGTAM